LVQARVAAGEATLSGSAPSCGRSAGDRRTGSEMAATSTMAAPARPLGAQRRRRRTDWLPVVAVAVLAAAGYAWFYYGRGLDVPDEGLLLHVADRLARGEVPYRDVYFIYTPGLQYLLAAAFRAFGSGLTVEHALQLALHVLLAVVVYVLAARLAGSRLVAALAAAVVIVAGLNSYRFLLGLATVLALTAYAGSGRRRWLFAAGLLVGLTYLFAQEVGLYALGAALGVVGLAWLARALSRLSGGPIRSTASWSGLQAGSLAVRTVVVGLAGSGRRGLRDLGRDAALLGAGVALVLGPWLLVLAAQQALLPMLDATVRVAFLDQPRYMHVPLPPPLPLVPTDLSTNVVWGPPPYLLYVKTLLYLPLLVVALAWLVVAWGARGARLVTRDQASGGARRLAVLPLLLFATLALATVADRADYYHLRQVLPVTLVLLAWLLARLGGALGGWRRAGLVALLPFLPLLLVSLRESADFRAEQAVPLSTARGTVLVDETKARDLGGLLQAIEANTGDDEAIFVWPAETAVYFLANRRNPTRFGQLVPTELDLLREQDDREQRAIVAALDAANVAWGVAAPTDNVDGLPFAAYAPRLAAYLQRHYAPRARFGYWTLERRTPASAPP